MLADTSLPSKHSRDSSDPTHFVNEVQLELRSYVYRTMLNLTTCVVLVFAGTHLPNQGMAVTNKQKDKLFLEKLQCHCQSNKCRLREAESAKELRDSIISQERQETVRSILHFILIVIFCASQL